MATWHRGTQAVEAALQVRLVPIPELLNQIRDGHIPRVPGTAVFLTRMKSGTPPVLLWHLRNNRALHTYVIALTIQVKPIPWVDPADRLQAEELAENLWRLTASYGFMEQPDIPALIAAAKAHGCASDLSDVTYYIGRETVLHRPDGQGLPPWRESIFAFMLRNSAQAAGFLRLPRDGVVEIGRQVEI
jgi:KUP system potassium uptake protein